MILETKTIELPTGLVIKRTTYKNVTVIDIPTIGDSIFETSLPKSDEVGSM